LKKEIPFNLNSVDEPTIGSYIAEMHSIDLGSSVTDVKRYGFHIAKKSARETSFSNIRIPDFVCLYHGIGLHSRIFCDYCGIISAV
jgi:hypothetical protein